jgi:cytochrome d ubiquinol oxidase subunit I
MKLAAMEGLWDGDRGAGIVAAGILNGSKQPGDSAEDFIFSIKIPGLLSFLANREPDSFVPGINDLVYGNSEENVMGAGVKIEKGKKARSFLADYKKAKADGRNADASAALDGFGKHVDFLGYGFLENREDIVPPVSLTFYSFHIMVILGTAFILLFILFMKFAISDSLEGKKWLLYTGVFSFFAGLVASQCGWIVAEVGRQPWAIQGLLPVTVARSNLTTDTVMTTFFMFLVTFTALLIAEINIMLKQIKIGPEEK